MNLIIYIRLGDKCNPEGDFPKVDIVMEGTDLEDINLMEGIDLVGTGLVGGTDLEVDTLVISNLKLVTEDIQAVHNLVVVDMLLVVGTMDRQVVIDRSLVEGTTGILGMAAVLRPRL